MLSDDRGEVVGEARGGGTRDTVKKQSGFQGDAGAGHGEIVADSSLARKREKLNLGLRAVVRRRGRLRCGRVGSIALAGRAVPAFLLADADAADRASLELLRYVALRMERRR